MKHALWILSGAGVALLAAAASASSQEMSPEDMAKWAQYSTPGEHHEQLEPIIGRWNETIKLWFTPDAPPTEETATSTAEWILDGRYIRHTHEGTMMGQPFHGTEIFGYDNFGEEYVSIWIDNHSTAPMITRGTYDPATNTITMSGTYDDFMTGKEDQAIRTVTHWEDADTFVYEMYGPGPDGQEFKMMEVTGRRAQPAAGGQR